MKAVFEYLVTVFVAAFIKALSQPGVAAGLIDPIMDAFRRHQIQASKPNQDDEDFKASAAADGWPVDR